MKKRVLLVLLALEAAVLTALIFMADLIPNLFSTLLAFPFEQLGAALRELSLSGQVGNGLALAALICISMLPLIPVLRHIKDRAYRRENAALALTAVLLFAVTGAMANPELIYRPLDGGAEFFLPVIKAIMGAAVWSSAVLWIVLRLLRMFSFGETDMLLRYLKSLLYALCAVFVGVIVISSGGTLLYSLREAQKAIDGIMAVIRFAVDALPYILDIAITLSAVRLAQALIADEEQADAAECAEKMSKLCCTALAAVTVCVTLLNVIELLLIKQLSNALVTVNIPITSIAFALVALLGARLIAENKRLREDNDLFI